MTPAKQRNWNIMQLRGMAPRMVSLIPDDIKYKHKAVLKKVLESLVKDLDKVKVKKFTCAQCTDTTLLHLSKNKRAYCCDLCGNYAAGQLYNLSKMT